jgi:predicted phage terminase large subunit-like protein
MMTRPQPGQQEKFLSTPADICIYGGAAGGGKTWGLLLEPLRHMNNPTFTAVIFRRTTKQVRNPGGLWDESQNLYPLLNAESNESHLQWTFPTGATLHFAHMEHEKNRLDWQGSQITLVGFDELTHFTQSQFMYMLSRNRSVCGVRPYIRATTNPDSDSWVATLIDWWIDAETGFIIPERSGVLRWFVRDGEQMIWSNNPDELRTRYPTELPKSLTFIAASIYDNQILLAKDPGYLSNLKALPRVDRERLLEGNWKIRPSAGLFFKRSYFEIIDALPADMQYVRYWDRAATEKTETNDPDWTAGIKLGKTKDGQYVICDVVRFRESPLKVKTAIINTASQDGKACPIILEQEPGASGKSEAQDLVRELAGYNVRREVVTQKKVVRASPFSAQCEAGNVKLLRAPWNEAFLNELECFPEGKHDDQVDAASGAFNKLAARRTLSIL